MPMTSKSETTTDDRRRRRRAARRISRATAHNGGRTATVAHAQMSQISRLLRIGSPESLRWSDDRENCAREGCLNI
jgi:hypothetical protein